MPRWSRSNPLALAVLVCLYEKPMHPYEVAQTLRTRAKEQSGRLNYGSLYAVVESLEKKGFIKATGTVREGKRPQRTIYEITDEGSVEMTDWLTELIATPNKEYPAFQAGLSFLPALDPDDALAALRHRAEALTMKLVAMRGAMQAARTPACPGSSSSSPSTRSARSAPSTPSSGRSSRRWRTGRSRASSCGASSRPRTSTPRRCTSPSNSPRSNDPRPRVAPRDPGSVRPRADPRGTFARGST